MSIKNIVLGGVATIAIAIFGCIQVDAGGNQSTMNSSGQCLNLGTNLIWAAEHGKAQRVKELIAQGADVNFTNERGSSALIQAALHNHKAVVSLLLDNGAEVNAVDTHSGDTSLMLATWNGHIDIVKLLLRHGADITIKNLKEENALKHAETRGWNDITNLLHSASRLP